MTNSTIGGGITNTGTITANGANSNFATSINITGSTVSSGITNAGTINASDMNVNANADVLNFTGGRIVLSPTQSISGRRERRRAR